VRVESPNSAVIYELHLRDLTTDANSGSSFPGKYLGLAERGTKSTEGLSTGLDHLIELGITHVHLLPVFDHQSIDETRLHEPQFNWGYDPQNYNVPEGSYSSDPYRAEVRITEFKQMVKALHDVGIGVVMDVVYNHTGKTEGSNFNLECPDYYYRKDTAGNYSNASGCGNETASERAMMRKFMLESLLYWQKEYHIDGFRFDLMAIHDLETMNYIADSLKEINPSCLIYGEGWTGGATPLPVEKQALKKHAQFMRNVSVFNDDLRDGIKGSVFDNLSTGFVSGAPGMEESIKFGIIGAIQHDDLHYKRVNYSDTTWAIEPWQSISYASCHDNHTLYDKLKVSCPDLQEDEIQSMQMLALGIVLTSQGIPFLHAGTEMLRSKQGEHNSYNLPDEINQLIWKKKADQYFVFQYLSDLIQMRKDHPAFRLASSGEVRKYLDFHEVSAGLVSYTISEVAGDEWKQILVVYNAADKQRVIEFKGTWNVVALESKVNQKGIKNMTDQLEIPPRSMFIAYRI
jgi:pullulanase